MEAEIKAFFFVLRCENVASNFSIVDHVCLEWTICTVQLVVFCVKIGVFNVFLNLC